MSTQTPHHADHAGGRSRTYQVAPQGTNTVPSDVTPAQENTEQTTTEPTPEVTRTALPQGEQSRHPTGRRRAKNKKQKGAPKAKPERVKRRPPDGVQIPVMGRQAALYWLLEHLGRPDKVPPIGQRERIHLKEEVIRSYADQIQITIWVGNFVGTASKSLTAVVIGGIIANLTHRHVLVLPATENTATATAAMYAGISPHETLTVRQTAAAAERGEIPNFRALSGKVKLMRGTGLVVLTEDPVRDVNEPGSQGSATFDAVADLVHDMVDVLIFDTGNDDVYIGTTGLSAMRRSDVAVFTAFAGITKTLMKLTATMSTYMTDTKTERVRMLGHDDVMTREGMEIPTTDKVADGIVLISGVPRKEDPEEYRKYTYTTGPHGNPQTVGFNGTFLTTPKDKYLAGRDNVVAHPDSLERNTYEAYLDAIIATYESAARSRGVTLTNSTSIATGARR